MEKANGFTLVELVIIVLLMGIIGTIAGSRFTSMSSFSNRANKDSIKFALKMAQKTAIAQRRDIYVFLSTNELHICYENIKPCPNNQMLLVQGKPYSINTSKMNIVLPDIKFNSKGNIETPQVTVQVNSKNLYIEEESGYIHE